MHKRFIRKSAIAAVELNRLTPPHQIIFIRHMIPSNQMALVLETNGLAAPYGSEAGVPCTSQPVPFVLSARVKVPPPVPLGGPAQLTIAKAKYGGG
jgi:hypothetical protein